MISDGAIPQSVVPLMQHALDTYASETNKTASVWALFSDCDLNYRPHERSATVHDIFKHQLLSERRFFAEFLGLNEPAAATLLPSEETVSAFERRLVELAVLRLAQLAEKSESWWMEQRPFFEVERQRAWIFWRRVLHSAHHRTQLTVFLRMMNKPVPSTYGPTADITWKGADPTTTIEAASRKL